MKKIIKVLLVVCVVFGLGSFAMAGCIAAKDGKGDGQVASTDSVSDADDFMTWSETLSDPIDGLSGAHIYPVYGLYGYSTSVETYSRNAERAMSSLGNELRVSLSNKTVGEVLGVSPHGEPATNAIVQSVIRGLVNRLERLH